MKKFFLSMFMLAAIISFQLIDNSKVSAQDVWVYTDGNGKQYYVMTEIMVNKTQYRANRSFRVNVKSVCRKNKVTIDTYEFHENDCMEFCSINGGEAEFFYQNEAAKRIWNYGLKYLGLDYEVRCDG
ncbi:MAG: hypothetical protein IJ797_06630 [Selenomonadaceae bacterium]|nr:hypothetical protein [Selenomonadaceae bacterium]